MNVLLVIGLILLFALIGIAVLFWLSSRPIDKDSANSKIQKLLEREVNKKETITQALVKAESGGIGFSETFGFGENEKILNPAIQPFHAASVGKAFTAVLTGMLADEEKLSLEDPISLYLDDEILNNLFLYEGRDYSEDVTISHLLSHRSGIADYFDDEADGSLPMAELVLSRPDKIWTPEDLIAFTRDFQESKGIPGEQFHYSDTGYILLGLIIEKASGFSFHEALHQMIFNPLKMDDSYVAFYSQPKNEKTSMADIWFHGTEISEFNSLSIDWAGGGIVSTLDDLSVFVRALEKDRLISPKTKEDLYRFDSKFIKGISYGLGIMEYRFEDFFPTLSFLPHMRGHMGVLGTQMLYDGKSDTLFICSFGSTDYAAGSVRTMIKILSLLSRIK